MKPEPTTVSHNEQLVRITEVRGGGACGVCGNQVTWARTIAGSMMPLEHGLRVRALLSPELRSRGTIRLATKPGTTHHELVKDDAHARRLEAKGCRIREELVEFWEIPASLTHFANCKAKAPRQPRRPRR
ncbi:MAG: hypothetical protein KDE27_20190 [Planctomycetes bacterium]|nr:hypothetical protein [Planctomycetota bacterium]